MYDIIHTQLFTKYFSCVPNNNKMSGKHGVLNIIFL